VPFSPSSTCEIAGTGTPGVATCTVSFPATAGTYKLLAGYGGDGTHMSSGTFTTVTVGGPAPAATRTK
jgi:hypothetical protein